VLVLRGEAGIGKTALLDHFVARATGVEAERELPHAGLQQLCAPFLDRLEHLPGPQRAAVGTAFGLFLSSRTVEWHLRGILPKLGIGSRRALRLVLPGGEQLIST
jgi:hypothetical protein